jgi:hypothetical protein
MCAPARERVNPSISAFHLAVVDQRSDINNRRAIIFGPETPTRRAVKTDIGGVR